MPIMIEYTDEVTGDVWYEESLLDDEDCKEVLWTDKRLKEMTIQAWPTLEVPDWMKSGSV